MAIELIVLNYLADAQQDVPVYAEEPELPGERYIIVEKVGSSRADLIDSAVIAVQSYAESMEAAILLNQQVKKLMQRSPEALAEITRCKCTGDYNHPDLLTKRYRYQAVFDITYYEE